MTKENDSLQKGDLIGKCHICGRIEKLSFEHVPPKRALNSNKAFMYLGKDVIGLEKFPWDLGGVAKKQLQRGIGFNTLCEKCNNDTGAWYGGAFVDFTRQGYEAIINNEILDKKSINIQFRNIYPLRVIKEIIAMFFSINNPELSSAIPEFRDFVLDREKRGISEDKYGFYIFISTGRFLRYIGIGGILYSDKSFKVASELCAPPFGYIFEIDPKGKNQSVDITFFANNYTYNDCVNITIEIPVLGISSYLPLDYRNKEQIIQDFYLNVLRLIESGFKP